MEGLRWQQNSGRASCAQPADATRPDQASCALRPPTLADDQITARQPRASDNTPIDPTLALSLSRYLSRSFSLSNPYIMSFILTQQHLDSVLAHVYTGDFPGFLAQVEPEVEWRLGASDEPAKGGSGVYVRRRGLRPPT